MHCMTKRDHIIRVKNSKGHFTSVVRERYLRDDISCRSRICSRCVQGDNTFTLSKDVTHYLVPDCQAALQYLDIFEFEEISGVIFMQTCVQHVLSKIGRKQQQKFRKLLQDARQDCVVFNNLFHKECFSDRDSGETSDQWNTRLVYRAAVWYYNHLECRIPVVMISDNEEVLAQYSDRTLNVFVMGMGDYLQMFQPNHAHIHDVFESLDAVIHDGSQTQVAAVGHTLKEFKEYLPVDVLETQVKLGRYIQGTLRVNKFNPKEGYVTPLSYRYIGDVTTCGYGKCYLFVKYTDATFKYFTLSNASESLSKENERLEDILIPSVGRRNRAIHGDHVVVEIIPKSPEQQTSAEPSHNSPSMSSSPRHGRVVGILQRNWRDYVACFEEDEVVKLGKRSGKVLVVPFDYRIPKIRISTSQIEKLRNDRIVVRIDNWKTDSLYPCGHFIRSLGPIGDLKTESSVILVEHSLLTLPFTEAQLREMPSNDPQNPWVIEKSELAKRKDLRNTHLIFSIDPKGCEDVDDTLSVRELENGDLELGVHIADVTHFVKPNSFTDLEARSRSTTVYLADRRYDMLPGVLSADLCSLLSGVDRYAVSVLWVLDCRTYEVKDVWYGKTIIRSRYKLFYEIAQAIAEEKVSNSELMKDIPELQSCSTDSELNASVGIIPARKKKAIKEGITAILVSSRVSELRWSVMKLMDIARKLKSVRTSQGALELEGVEVQVQLGDKKEIEDLVPKNPLEVHETIAECMIFANHWVAKRILKSFPNCALLRRHPLPRQDQFSNVINCAKSKGFVINTSSNKSLALSLDNCVDPKDQLFNKIIRSLTTQAMSNALYFSTGSISQDQYFHYGLALDKYTHFTSPIRRYADVIVHRQLMMAISCEEGQNVFSNQELQEVATNMNTKHRESQNAQRDSVQLFQALYFRDLDENDERRFVEGIVFQTRDNGVLVTVERYGLKGPLILRNDDGHVVCPLRDDEDGIKYVCGTLVKDELGVSITNSSGSFRFQLFDHLKVRVRVSHSRAHGDSVKLELASCYPNKVSKSCSMSEEQIKQQKQQLIKDVREFNEGNNVKSEDETDHPSELSRLAAVFGQTHEALSLYCLLNDFKDLALQE